MAKTLEEYLKENPTAKIGDADMALGRNNFGALEGILEARQKWSQATTQEEKDAAHQTAENIRKAYGQYSGGADGMEGKYSPTYTKPNKTAENSNVDALFQKYNNAYQNAAPTYTPQYEAQIQELLSGITNREAFSYDMNADANYQQYRDQYIREGKRAMQDAAGQTAALTGGYGSTYGAIAAQQGYDNYLAGLNDVVPELEQQAYGRYMDNLTDMYNQIGAYQTEENRLYSQYLDSLSQYNTDRSFAYNAMQDAVSQNNYENQFDRSLYESDRDYELGVSQWEAQWEEQQKQQRIENALATGDYSALQELGYNTSYLSLMQDADIAKARAAIAELNGAASGYSGTASGYSGTSSGSSRSSGKSRTTVAEDEEEKDSENTSGLTANGYTYLVLNYKMLGDTEGFQKKCAELMANGSVSDADYEKFLAKYGK